MSDDDQSPETVREMMLRARSIALRPVRPQIEAVIDRRVTAEVERLEKERAKQLRRQSRFRYVFVVAPGRSGSTLVQGLLNVVPHTLVRGENDFYIHDLFRIWQRLVHYRHEHRLHRTHQVVSAFYGLLDIRRRHFADAARQIFVDSATTDHDRAQIRNLGFKEVLWHRIEAEETERFFNFFEHAFPRAHYVLNTRDVENITKSGFWNEHDPDDALRAIKRVHEVQDYLRESRPTRVFDVRYETITGDDADARDEMLRGLAEFVTHQSCHPSVLAEMVSVLGKGYGPRPFGTSHHDNTSDAERPQNKE